jgi:hypothetical protein
MNRLVKKLSVPAVENVIQAGRKPSRDRRRNPVRSHHIEAGHSGGDTI